MLSVDNPGPEQYEPQCVDYYYQVGDSLPQSHAGRLKTHQMSCRKTTACSFALYLPSSLFLREFMAVTFSCDFCEAWDLVAHVQRNSVFGVKCLKPHLALFL